MTALDQAAFHAALRGQPESPEVSVVIPCFDEAENVVAIHAAVTRELSRHAATWEIILIDNGSTDGTRELMRTICACDPFARAILNNRNYGQMRSPTYAIYQAEGRAVIGMGADFQDPPALIGPLIAAWREGAGVVLAQRRTEAAGWATRAARWAGYRLLGRVADHGLVPGATGYGLFSRACVDTLAAWNEPEPFFRAMVLESGFPLAVIPYDRPARAAGETKNGLRTLTDFAVSGLAGSAKALLRAPLFLSLLAAPVAALLLALAAAGAVLGWGATALLAVLGVQAATFGVLLLFLGLIGEQVRAIGERTRHVPLVVEAERIGFPPGREAPAARTHVRAGAAGVVRAGEVRAC